MVMQSAALAFSLMLRQHADLCDMRPAVNDVDDDVAQWFIERADGDPTAPRCGVTCQFGY